jgi:serine/threonine protein kinase
MATAGIPGYVVTGKLGSGSDSEVYECVDKKTGRKAAVKVIRKDQAPERLERSRKEAEVLELLDHPHVVKMHEWFETDEALYIVLECAGGGDLFEVLYSHELNPSQTVLEERCARRIFTQTALAVSHMHRNGVCHRDLKPENIFLDSEWNVKVGDFGLSLRYLPGRKANDPVGSLIYASPEVLRRESYTGPELDVWALGILLYEMLCGTPPFVADTERDLCKAILAGEYSVPDFVTPGARSLISKMIKLKHYRITLDEVLTHPWVVDGLPTAVSVQRRSRKRRGSIISASPEEPCSPRESRQTPREGRKKRKEGSSRASRSKPEEEPSLTDGKSVPVNPLEPGLESDGEGRSSVSPPSSSSSSSSAASPKDFMIISGGMDISCARAQQSGVKLLDDEEEREEVTTGGCTPLVMSLEVTATTETVETVTTAALPGLYQQKEDDITGTLTGDLEKLKLTRDFPAYSKTASVREAVQPVPPLRSLSSPVVHY